jgi:hypothetical protein
VRLARCPILLGVFVVSKKRLKVDLSSIHSEYKVDRFWDKSISKIDIRGVMWIISVGPVNMKPFFSFLIIRQNRTYQNSRNFSNDPRVLWLIGRRRRFDIKFPLIKNDLHLIDDLTLFHLDAIMTP